MVGPRVRHLADGTCFTQRQPRTDPLCVLHITEQINSQELVFDFGSMANDDDKRCGRKQSQPRADSHRARRNRDAHGQVAGMANESVRASVNQVMSTLALDAQHRREEWVLDHRPGLQRGAGRKYHEGTIPNRRWHYENWVQSTHRESGDGECQKEQGAGGAAQSVVDA